MNSSEEATPDCRSPVADDGDEPVSLLKDSPAAPLAVFLDHARPWSLAGLRVEETGLRLRFTLASGEAHELVASARQGRGSLDRRGAPAPALDDVVAWLEPRLSRTPGSPWSWLSSTTEAGLPETRDECLARLSPWLSGDALGGGYALAAIESDGEAGWLLEFHGSGLVPYQVHCRVDAQGGVSFVDYATRDHPPAPFAAVELRCRVQLAMGPPQSEPVHRSELAPIPRATAGVPGKLTEEQLARFKQEGYLVIPGAVSQPLVAGVVRAIRWFLDLDPTLYDQWYFEIPRYRRTPGFLRSGNFLELYQHQALWDVRQAPAVYGAFRDLWGRDDLWVSLDRVNMKPPVSGTGDERWHDPGFVHWDIDTSSLPLPFALQGMVALTAMDEPNGTFQCAPGMHLHLEAWAQAKGPNRDPRVPEPGDFEMVSIPLQPGDLLIWHHALPHGNGPNLSDDRVRMSQYINYFPAEPHHPEARLARIRSWRERRPGGSQFEGDPLQREAIHGTTAQLSGLGRRVLGLEPWPPQKRAGTP